MKSNLKTGQLIKVGNIGYLFLGYKDSAQKWGVLADKHGNKYEAYMSDLKFTNE